MNLSREIITKVCLIVLVTVIVGYFAYEYLRPDFRNIKEPTDGTAVRQEDISVKEEISDLGSMPSTTQKSDSDTYEQSINFTKEDAQETAKEQKISHILPTIELRPAVQTGSGTAWFLRGIGFGKEEVADCPPAPSGWSKTVIYHFEMNVTTGKVYINKECSYAIE